MPAHDAVWRRRSIGSPHDCPFHPRHGRSMSTTGIAPAGAIRRPWLVAAGIAAAATLLVSVLLGLGILSMPGLAVAAIFGFTGLIALLWFAPQLLVVIGPGLIHLPLVWVVFPYELPFAVFAALVALQVMATRPRW